MPLESLKATVYEVRAQRTFSQGKTTVTFRGHILPSDAVDLNYHLRGAWAFTGGTRTVSTEIVKV